MQLGREVLEVIVGEGKVVKVLTPCFGDFSDVGANFGCLDDLEEKLRLDGK